MQIDRLGCRRGREALRCQIQAAGQLEQPFFELTQRQPHVLRLVYHDALTGVHNRTLLQVRFGQAISKAQRQHRLVAVLSPDPEFTPGLE